MITVRIKYRLTLLFACLLGTLYAGEVTVRRIPLNKELPSNTVYRMFQDSDGFIWLGTTNGFCRYDGYAMQSFRSEAASPTFASNYITGGFAEDTLHHTLWIGTEKGVILLDKRTHAIEPLDEALLGNSPVRQLCYGNQAVWICTDDGLYLYNTDKTLRKKYLGGANSIHIDNAGIVRVTVWNEGVYYLDKATDTFLPYPQIGADNNPHKIFQDREGRFWICTWRNGLYRFYPDRQGAGMFEYMDMPLDKSLNLDIFFDVEQDDVNGYLWTLSYAGVTVFNLDGNRIVPVEAYTTAINNRSNLFSDIMKDRAGNIWLGTYNQGVIIVNPSLSSVTSFDLRFIKDHTGYDPNIIKVFEDEDGELWMRQSRIGFFILNPETAVVRRLNRTEIHAANAIIRNSETGEIWVAMDYNPIIYRLRKSNGNVVITGRIDMQPVLGEATQVIKFLHEDKNKVIWAATNHTLLSFTPPPDKSLIINELDPKSHIPLSLKSGEWRIVNGDCGTITGITEDSFGAIWLSTAENGLWQVVSNGDEITLKNYSTQSCPIAGNKISCISAAADGQIWFCVNEKQLFSYDIAEQQFIDHTQRANVGNLVIQNIIAGDDGHVWISSIQQVIEFNPSIGASVQYDVQPDLMVTSLNLNAVTKMRNGSVVIGGTQGLCIFTHSTPLEMPGKRVKTLLTDLKINGKPTYQSDIKHPDWQKKLVLYPKESNIEIYFSSLNYLNPDNTRYACKLEGVDEQWVYIEPGRNFAVYNQLRKGDYIFSVKSTNDNLLWSDEVTRFVITKKPAFYETAWAYACYAILALLALFAALKFYLNRIQLRNKLHIAQIDKEMSDKLIQTKLQFFTNIGHEFRTPLTLIMTPLSTLIHQLADENLKQKLRPVYRNAEDMLELINQLLDFQKLEMGGEKLKLSCDDFIKFIEYSYLIFKDFANGKSIRFTFESEVKQLFMGFDKTKVRKIINNLYSNALKFTPEDGTIATAIRLVQLEGREFVHLEIADSGCGISDKEQQKIFGRFYQGENNDPETATGSGIGLHLTYEYVTLHDGRITVQSKEGEGSVFSVFIPTDLSVSVPVPEQADTPDGVFETDIPTEYSPLQQELKTLLIVEDNAELRRFLAEQLGEHYLVLQAEDGKQGLSIARKKAPDLIISDLMMPLLNGLEMCQRLKNDIQTSHIPIILLTAKISDEIKIETYKAGADSYITKPFSFEVLLTRIEMLIEQQEKHRKLFHKTIEITPNTITTTSLDEELIKRALNYVEKNMDNSEYSVDNLAVDLSFSRRQLARKFNSIIGLSPNEFIRSIRLKRAAQLLTSTQHNISEIAYMVGFSTIKYFNQHFKDEFGITPTRYRSENKK